MPKKREHNPYRIKLANGSTIERDYRTDEAGNQVPYGNWKWVVYDPTRRPRTKKVNLKDWITFGFGTGLRPGEQRQLKWSAVSLAERSVGKGHRTKTSKSARTVPVRGDPLAVLQRRVKARKGTKDDYVFTGKGGDPVEPCYVTKQIQSFAEAAEIEKNVVAYSLRHGYGTRMAQAGVPLWELANLMGTSMKMIECHYGHYDPNRGAAHVDRVFGTNGSDTAPNGSGDNQEKGLQDGATRRKNTKAK